MFAAVTVKNKKKRKRLPAKDWPPTSAQKKVLVPYGRPLKLPRLDESPYKEVWIKIVRLILADLRGYKGCCRKMKYFWDVHRELLLATRSTYHTNSCCQPLQITKRYVNNRGKKYPNLRVCSARGSNRYTYTNYDLRWIPYKKNTYIEKLVWIDSKTYYTRQVTHLSRNRPDDIVRFTRASRWEAFICDYIHGRIENGIRFWTYKNGQYNDIGSNALEYLIRMAPNYLDRATAKKHVLELIGLHDIRKN